MLGRVVAVLPAHIIYAHHIVHSPVAWFWYGLAALAFVGGAAVARRGVRERDPMLWFVTAVFVVPFVAYAGMGLVLERFGEPRNFFYLLPVYSCFVARRAAAVAPWKAAFVVVPSLVVFGTAYFGLTNAYEFWCYKYRDAEMLSAAAARDEDCVAVNSRQETWGFLFTAERLGAPSAYRFCEQDTWANVQNDFADIHARAKASGTFVVIEDFADRASVPEHELRLGDRSYVIADVSLRSVADQPFRFLQSMYPQQSVIVVFVLESP
ncbi:MAG: hypothetical protein AAF628_28295 [Planctomycetota bacterium]